jgi:hypothetical protein
MRSSFLSVLIALLPLVSAAAQDTSPLPEPGGADEVEISKLVMAFNTPGHVGRIRHLVFTPDSKRLISVGMDRTAQIWDVQTGQRLRVLRLPCWASAVALAPDGKTLLVGGTGYQPEPDKSIVNQVYLLNLQDGRLLPLLGTGPFVKGVAFAADGDRAFGDEGGTCSIWTGLKNVWDRKPDPAGIKARAQVGSGRQPAPALSPSPDGTRLALRTGDHKTFHIWDFTVPDKPVARATQSFPREVRALAWSPDGKQVASGHNAQGSGGANVVRLWSPEGAPLRSFVVEDVSGDRRFTLQHLLFRNRNELLIFASKRPQQVVLSLNLKDGSVREVCRHANQGAGVARYSTIEGALSPDGDIVAFSTGPGAAQVALFMLTGKASLHFLPRERDGSEQNRATPEQIGWAPKGFTIAWNAQKLTDLDTALDLEQLQMVDSFDPKTFVRPISKRGRWEIKPAEGADGRRMAIFHNGKQVGQTPPHAQALHSWTLPFRGEVTWLAWVQGASLYVGEAATGKLLRTLPGALFVSVASSPDGKYLLASDVEQMLWIFRPDQSEPLLRVFTSGPHWIVWAPKEGYYAASPGGERLMGWTSNNGPNQVATFYPAERFRKVLYRPDVIRLVLEKGSVAAALKEANARAGLDGETPAEVGELLPPRATLVLVGDPGARVTVRVKGEAVVKSQPVQALRLLLDGRPFPDGQFNLEIKPGTRPEATWQVEVPPGKHELKVLVRGKDTVDVSNAVMVRTDVPEDQKPTLYCLPVGINYNWGGKVGGLKLNAAENDARNMLKALKDNCTGTGNQFRAVVGEALLGEKATKQAVLEGLKEIRKKGVKPGDLVVLFFACHGVAEKGGFFLLAADVDLANIPKTGLSGAALREALKEMPCQVLLIFDACQSGAALAKFTPATDELGRALSDDEAAVTVLTAAMASEKALEVKNNGVFTHAFREALAHGFFDREEGEMHVYHLYSKVIDLVRKDSGGKQHPLLLTPWTMPPLVLRKVQGTGE